MIFYELFMVLAGPGLLTTMLLAAMWLAGRRLTWTSTTIAAVGFAAVWQLGIFSLPRTAALETTVDPYRPGIDFVAEFLKDKRASHPPQVYSSLRRLEVVWVDWRAQSYYDVSQTAGFLFTREATMEGLRRAPLVGPFEVDYVLKRKAVLLPEVLAMTEKLGEFDASKPLEPSHLRQLASDPRLDWIVLWDVDSQELLDLATAVGTARGGVRRGEVGSLNRSKNNLPKWRAAGLVPADQCSTIVATRSGVGINPAARHRHFFSFSFGCSPGGSSVLAIWPLAPL